MGWQAWLVEMADGGVEAMLATSLSTPVCYADVEIHNWQFGGRTGD